ncbi:MAG: hypothetical protein TREMPRED_000411 [Tremellales sp. Tagirdzhanova-0007]|nr:MAG: hypothetical protein TREMPRED_000411 [Tremellales sp. Tagirdzhanova-0007]
MDSIRGVAQHPSILRTRLRTALSRLTDSSTPLLPFIPKPVKWLLLLIILGNAPSFPFLWHVRVWWAPIKAYFLLFVRGRARYLEGWKRANSASGSIKVVTRMRRIAWLDDCDYNFHLSNSAYAKSLDSTRMDWAIQAFSPFFTAGSHMALGSAHYIFLREIPMGMEYTMESRAAGWGDKWFFLVTEFIIYPKKRSGKAKPSRPSKDISLPSSLGVPDISTSEPEPTPDHPTPVPTTIEEVKRSEFRSRPPRADGGIACCFAISEYCFKIGRVTIPPRVAMLYGMLSSTPEGQDRAKRLILRTQDRGKSWLEGGWRDELDATTMGSDIGTEGGSAWIDKGRDAMDRINEALGDL